MTALREGGVDDGGSFVAYRYEGRAEQGWVLRVFPDGLLQIETFSGDYLVTHWVRREKVLHLFNEAEIAEAMRP